MQNANSELIMRELHIHQNQSYEDNPGKYKCKITYAGSHSEHSLTLNETISERLLAFIGPAICEAAAMVAEETKKNIERSIEAMNNHVHAIEAGDLVNAGVAGPRPEPVPTPDSPAAELENLSVPREPTDSF